MIITVAGFKGGVAKTTTAVHLAACLSQKAKTLLIDGDPNRSATNWAARRESAAGGLPFKVIDERQAAMQARNFEHIIIDTQARPEKEDLEQLAAGCDLLILPTTPDALALDALQQTILSLKQLGTDRFKILLTIVPPKPSKEGDEARNAFIEAGLPVFKNYIRRYAAFPKAAHAGVIVCDVSDSNAKQAWNDYCAIGKEILSNGKGKQVQGFVPGAATNATSVRG